MRLSRNQIRQVDKVAIEQWGVPGVLLMENAGRGAAEKLCQLGIEGKVLIVCAKGNNGGDGFVIARHLHLRGYRTEVFLACDESHISGDAQVNFALLKRCSVRIHRCDEVCREELSQQAKEADLLIDAMLGTGAVGEPRQPLPQIISALNAAQGRRIAIDIPTGLDAQSGVPATTTFMAHHTLTFVAEKQGFSNSLAAPYLGQIHAIDIGLPWELVLQAIE